MMTKTNNCTFLKKVPKNTTLFRKGTQKAKFTTLFRKGTQNSHHFLEKTAQRTHFSNERLN